MSVNIFKNGQLHKIAGNTCAEDIISFDSGDNLEPVQATDVPLITSSETHKSLFHKLSTMARNTRYLLKMLGSTDISHLGNGTVTGAISAVAADIPVRYKKISGTIDSPYSTINAYRVGNLIVVDLSIWHNYTSADTQYLIGGELNIGSLLNPEEHLNEISAMLQGVVLTADSTSLIPVNIQSLVWLSSDKSGLAVGTTSSKIGVYVHRFSRIYSTIKT